MHRTLVIYASRYGSTEEAAKKISLILGPSRLILPEAFTAESKDADFVVLGTPVYQGSVDPGLMALVRDNREWLMGKRPVLFCTCLDPRDGIKALSEIKDLLAGEITSMRVLGGRLSLEKLRQDDRTALEGHSQKAGYTLADVDALSTETVVDYALELKRMMDGLAKAVPRDALKSRMDEFLRSHNTCALATGSREPRATPVEYTYLQEKIYILSEGGEKFAHLLLNPRVSLAVYDPYQGMDSLAGMQITGQASLVDATLPEYREVIEARGLSIKKLQSPPFSLNLIKVELEKVEFLDAEFLREGFDIRQVLLL